MRCMLACSWVHSKRFSLSGAMIMVDASGAECSITFADGCIQCGSCADACFYGALAKQAPEEVMP